MQLFQKTWMSACVGRTRMVVSFTPPLFLSPVTRHLLLAIYYSLFTSQLLPRRVTHYALG